MKEKIIEILGTLDPPELQDIKAKRIMVVFQMEMIEMIKNNYLCSSYCNGFDRFIELIKELE